MIMNKMSRQVMPAIHSIMVNPFRKSLVTGISKLNRLGLTASMQSRRTSHPDPNSAIEQQSLKHPFDVFVGWGFEGLISKVEGFVNQFGADVFVHEAILEAGRVRRNS